MSHSPRPLVEEHYHIQELIESQQTRIDDRNYHRDRAKLAQERMDVIKDAKPKDLREFWCETCKLDFLAQSIKEVEIDWSCPTQYIAFYKTKCFEGHWCMRLITDRHRDSYWMRSRKVHQDRGRHYADVLQPWETGFNLLYGRKNKV